MMGAIDFKCYFLTTLWVIVSASSATGATNVSNNNNNNNYNSTPGRLPQQISQAEEATQDLPRGTNTLASILQHANYADLVNTLEFQEILDIVKDEGRNVILPASSLNNAREIALAFLRLDFLSVVRRVFAQKPASLWFPRPDGVSQVCYDHLMMYLEALVGRRGKGSNTDDSPGPKKTSHAEEWALSMFDATGKPNSGVLVGRLQFIGNYDQCVGARYGGSEAAARTGGGEPGTAASLTSFGGRYCRVRVPASQYVDRRLPENVNTFWLDEEHLPIDLNWGVCVPGSCGGSDMKTFLTRGTMGVFNIPVEEVICFEEPSLSDDGGAIFVVALLALFAFVVTLCTVLDLYRTGKHHVTSRSLLTWGRDNRERRYTGWPRQPNKASGTDNPQQVNNTVELGPFPKKGKGPSNDIELGDCQELTGNNSKIISSFEENTLAGCQKQITESNGTSGKTAAQPLPDSGQQDDSEMGEEQTAVSLTQVQGKLNEGFEACDEKDSSKQLECSTDRTEFGKESGLDEIEADSAPEMEQDVHPEIEHKESEGIQEDAKKSSLNTEQVVARDGAKKSSLNTEQVVARDGAKKSSLNTEEIVGRVKKETVYFQMIKGASLYNNLRQLLNTNISSSKPNIKCLEGLKAISMAWMVLGHTYTFGGILDEGNVIYDNGLEMTNIPHRLEFHIIGSAQFGVDTFFVISGCLVMFISLDKLQHARQKLKFWTCFVFHRFWRLTPIYMVVLAVGTTLYDHIVHGPLKAQDLEEFHQCRNKWWAHLLYINNLYAPKLKCMTWTWYLAVDMQFHVLSPLFIYPAFMNRRLGAILIVSLLVIGVTSAFVSELLYGGQFLLMDMNFVDYWSYVYQMPWVRVGAFAIGLLLGMVLRDYYDGKLDLDRWLKQKSTRRAVTALLWTLSLAVGFTLALLTHDQWKHGSGHWDRPALAVFECLSRPLWSAAVAWVIFACNTGRAGIVSRILSWPPFVTLSRLSYGVYLLHPVVILFVVYSRRTGIYLHPNRIDQVYNYLGNLVLAHLFAAVFYLLVECPVKSLEVLWTPARGRRKAN